MDKLWREAVKKKGQCEMCGSKTNQLHAHHLRSRRFLNTRFSIENGICLCAKCHFYAHQEPLKFADWIKETRGIDWYRKLCFKSELISKPVYNLLEKALNKTKDKIK